MTAFAAVGEGEIVGGRPAIFTLKITGGPA